MNDIDKDRVYFELFYLLNNKGKYFNISESVYQYYSIFVQSLEKRYQITDFKKFIKEIKALPPETIAADMNDVNNSDIDVLEFISNTDLSVKEIEIFFAKIKSYIFLGKLFFELYNIEYRLIEEILPDISEILSIKKFLKDSLLLNKQEKYIFENSKKNYEELIKKNLNNFKYDLSGLVQFAADRIKKYPIDYGVIKIYSLDQIDNFIEINIVEERNNLIIMFIKSSKDIKRAKFYLCDNKNNMILFDLMEISNLPADTRVFKHIRNLPVSIIDLYNQDLYKIIVKIEWN